MASPDQFDSPQPRKGWFSRNWKWALPVGCLSLLALCGCGLGGLAVYVFGALKNNDVYQRTVAAVQANPEAQAALGEPIEPGWMMQGNMNSSGDHGSANLNIPVSGPKGSGTAHVEAEKQQSGKWRFVAATLHIAGTNQEIDLLSDDESHGKGQPEDTPLLPEPTEPADPE